MIDSHFGYYASGVLAAATMLAGCSGSQTQPGQGFCPQLVPFVDLLYPIPGTKGVPPAVGQMVFAGTGAGRIQLIFGGYNPYRGKVPTKQKPLPNPLPSPMATPGQYGQYLTTMFAVSFRTLKSHTQYHAQVWQTYNQAPCNGGEVLPSGWADLGSFSTE
jgi:hypothetical protein